MLSNDDPPMKNNIKQFWLLALAALFILLYSIILTYAPLIRARDSNVVVNSQHWIGYIAWLISFFLIFYVTNIKIHPKDLFIIPVIALLTGLGLMTVWRLDPNLGYKQTIWLSIGASCVLIGILIPGMLDFVRKYKYIWLSIGFLLTSITLFLGVNPTGAGPNLWLGLRSFFIQPSEPLKLLIIIFLAAYFSDASAMQSRLISYLLPSLNVFLLTVLLLVSQRDIGTAMIFILLYSIIIIVTTQRRYLIWMIPGLLIVLSLIAYLNINIVRTRIDTWIDPLRNASGLAYQNVQALIATASGGLFGAGIGLGNPGVVPLAINDFIFTAISEEMGLLVSVSLILLFLVLMLRILNIAELATTLFQRYLAIGIGSYFSIQSIIIIGGNLNTLPLTGVTLPWVSYGGSSLVTNFLCLLFILLLDQENLEPIPTLPRNKAIRFLGIIFSLGFLALILANSWIAFIRTDKWTQRFDNPRSSIEDQWVKRGDILDQADSILVTTNGQAGRFFRINTYPSLSPVVGYSHIIYGQTGIEKAMDRYLRGFETNSYLSTWWQKQLNNQRPTGSDIRLSISLEIQQKADSLLAGTPGAIVLMNAKTGEILSMSSFPYFNSNDIETNWESLINDKTGSLLNRATQGSYPLGTAISNIALPVYLSSPAHNVIDLTLSHRIDLSCLDYAIGAKSKIKGIQFGCERAVNQLTASTDVQALLLLINQMGLFSVPDLPLDHALPSNPPENKMDLYDYFFTEGNFRVSPIQMAMVAAALSNSGLMPQPRIINSYLGTSGEWISMLSAMPIQVIESSTADKTVNLLQASSDPFWFTLGQFSTANGETGNTWFIGGTLDEWQGTPLAIAIVLESGEIEKAMAAGQLLLINKPVD